MLNRLHIGAGIAIAALVLTGCGGDDEEATTTSTEGDGASSDTPDVDPQEDPAAYFEAMSAASEEAGSYRMDLSMTGPTAAGQSQDMSTLVVRDGDEYITQITESGMGTEIIQTADTFYMKGMPGLPAEMEGKWVTMDISGALGEMLGSTSSATDMVNTDMFADVDGGLDVSVADGGEVDGVATQEISISLTPEQIAENNPLGEAATAMLEGNVDYVLTVGEDLLLREVSVSSGDVMQMDGTLYDYGVDETIEVPADEDTVTMEEAMQSSMEGLEDIDPGELEDSLGDLEDSLDDLEGSDLGDLEDGALGTEG